jgi:hypothetical protein
MKRNAIKSTPMTSLEVYEMKSSRIAAYAARVESRNMKRGLGVDLKGVQRDSRLTDEHRAALVSQINEAIAAWEAYRK